MLTISPRGCAPHPTFGALPPSHFGGPWWPPRPSVWSEYPLKPRSTLTTVYRVFVGRINLNIGEYFEKIQIDAHALPQSDTLVCGCGGDHCVLVPSSRTHSSNSCIQRDISSNTVLSGLHLKLLWYINTVSPCQ